MPDLDPLETLFDASNGDEVPLPAALAEVYGSLRIPRPRARPHVIGNFVTSLDGVVELDAGVPRGGGAIAGPQPHDRMVMGLLRAMADAIVVGAGTLRATPRHLWRADRVSPGFSEAHAELRKRLHKAPEPLNVIVTSSGLLDLDAPLFRGGEVPVLVLTTLSGEQTLRRHGEPPVQVVAVTEAKRLSADTVLGAIEQIQGGGLVLTEGGPQLIGEFFARGKLDELFLTLSPQVAGRDGSTDRPGLVAGYLFAPEAPIWGRLVSVKRAGSHLFLRYGFRL